MIQWVLSAGVGAQAMVARDVAAAITWALSTAMPAAEFAARLAVAEAGSFCRVLQAVVAS